MNEIIKINTIIIMIIMVFYNNKLFCQKKQIDSFLLVSYDIDYKYMDDFDGSPNVIFLKKMLDDKNYWYSKVDSTDKEETKLKYRCLVKNRRLLNRFESLVSQCDTSSYMDISFFLNIQVRIGLKIYKADKIEYMYIRPKGSNFFYYEGSEYFDKFIITETNELRATNALIRFFKKMKRKQRCKRC